MKENTIIIELREVFSTLYDTVEDCRIVAKDAGLNTQRIAFSSKTYNTWQYILEEAEKQGKIVDLIDVALKDYPKSKLHQFKDEYVALNSGAIQPVLDDEPVLWVELPDDKLEKIMGVQSALFPISWMEVGLRLSRSVVRIKRHDNKFGTGFLIDQNYLVTCHHVLPSEAIAQQAIIQCNYQRDADGVQYEPVNFQLNPQAGFKTSRANDWTLARVQGEINKEWGAIELNPVKIGEKEYATIIQHPAGGDKHIAPFHNVIEYVDETRVQYLTDTEPGSSGSPVFDSEWNLIAVHHAGGHLPEPKTRKIVYRNQGININCIIKDLQRKK